MLVLSRMVDERIIIPLGNGELIAITVLRIAKNKKQIQLGIDAPEKYRIYREEILRKEVGPQNAED